MAFPNPTYIAGVPRGVQHTQNIDQAGNMNQMNWSRSPRLFTMNGLAAPFQVLTNAIKAHETGWGADYRWQNDILPTQRDTMAGSVTSADGQVVVGNGAIWTVRDALYIPSAATASTPGAQAIVTAIAGNVLTIFWVVAPTGVLAPGTFVFRCANSYEEIMQAQIGPITVPGERYNYLTDVRHCAKASDRMVLGEYWLRPDKWTRDVNKKGQEHFKALEKLYLFMRRGLFATAPQATTPCMSSRGLYHWLATNRTTLANAVLTRAAWETWIDSVVGQNTETPQNWIVLCDDIITGRAISGFAIGMERKKTGETDLGMAISKYETWNGVIVNVIRHPLFRSHGYQATAILLNLTPKSIAIVMARGLATRRTDITAPSGGIPWLESSLISQYRTVTTLRVSGEEIQGGVLEDYTSAN